MSSSACRLNRGAARGAALFAVQLILRGVVVEIGLALVVQLDSFGQETFTPVLPAARKYRASVFGLHAGAESKLALARALRGLIGAFHSKAGSGCKP